MHQSPQERAVTLDGVYRCALNYEKIQRGSVVNAGFEPLDSFDLTPFLGFDRLAEGLLHHLGAVDLSVVLVLHGLGHRFQRSFG